jgi:hypothetical protein
MIRRYSGKELSIWLIFILVGILSVSYVTWHGEAKKNEGCLTGQIENTIVGPRKGTRNSDIFVEMWVSNRCQMPSTADIFTLSIDSGTLSIKPEQALIPIGFTLFNPTTGTRILQFHAFEALYKKTEQPINTGAKVDGWLAFEARDVTPDQILAKNVRYTISFFDTANNVCTTRPYLQSGAKRYRYAFVPGHVSGFR